MTAQLRVAGGPWLLRAGAPDLATHRATRGELPTLGIDDLLAMVERSGLRGRGGAGFPFATKLRTTADRRARRRHVVVNLSEGEPASFKDLALVLHQPHLVLDGAALVATALGAREIHLVAPGEHPAAAGALHHALEERARAEPATRRAWRLHTATPRFVAGEASAVTELVEGRVNLPVTSWQPAAVAGLRGQPTLLSNGETYAQVAALALGGVVPGTAAEPGTRLLSIGERSGSTRVVEVPHGTPWADVLSDDELAGPVLLGGYHGRWAPAGLLTRLTVSHADLTDAGLGLGAGIVLPLPPEACPLRSTAAITRYLASESAGRCGPCLNGLPALATAFEALVAGGPAGPVQQLTGLVTGRGACAHPDGTARLVVSAMTAFPDEVEAHARGGCAVHDGVLAGATVR